MMHKDDEVNKIPAKLVRCFAAVFPGLGREQIESASVDKAEQRDREPGSISWTHYVALEGSEVRGGFLLMEQPAILNAQVQRVTNSQSMLSEGIRERKYGVASIQMLKHLERKHEYLFMV